MPAKKKEEKISEETTLPEHIKDIVLRPHHIYANKNKRTGEMSVSTTKDFVTDLMRQFKIDFRVIEYRVDKFRDDKTLVSIVLEVFDNEGRTTPGVASMDRMPAGDQGQALIGQMVLTHALKNAVLRHLYITSNDIDLLIEKYGLRPREVAAREVVSITEEVEDMPLDLGEGFGSELEL